MLWSGLRSLHQRRATPCLLERVASDQSPQRACGTCPVCADPLGSAFGRWGDEATSQSGGGSSAPLRARAPAVAARRVSDIRLHAPVQRPLGRLQPPLCDGGQGLPHGLRGGVSDLHRGLPVTRSDSRMRASDQEPGWLAPGIARFTPEGVDPTALPRSLALERPWPARGPAPATWSIAPTFAQGSGFWQATIEAGDGTSL